MTPDITRTLPDLNCPPGEEREDIWPEPNYWNGIDPGAYERHNQTLAKQKAWKRVVFWPLSDADYTLEDFKREYG